MAINLSNYGNSRTKQLITREITNDESVGVNDNGLLINSNGKMGIDVGTTLSIESTNYMDIISGDYLNINTGTSLNLDIQTTSTINIGTTFDLVSGGDINIGTTNGGIDLTATESFNLDTTGVNMTYNNILLNSNDNTELGATGGGIYLNGDRTHSIQYNSDITIGSTTSWDITDDVNLGTTDYHYSINKERVLGKNILAVDTSSNINSTTGGLYLNKQDSSTDTSGDWRLRIDSTNDLIIENYTGALWKTKLKLSTG